MGYAVVAYVMWGFFAAYFPLLQPASPTEILAHRIIWTAGVMVVVVWASKSLKELRRADRSTWLLVFISAVLVAANWLIYVIAVNSGHVSEAALGYFINPLVNVVLGMLFLKERLRPLQKLSVGIAVFAVAMLTFIGGHPPYLGLALAFTFGFYGLFKKRVQLSASASLAAETIVIFPFAFGYLAWLTARGQSTFTSEGIGHTLLLMSAGLVTALPLLMFGKAARLVPLSTIGMLQYMTPTFQMMWAVFVMHEQLSQARWWGFFIIWISVAVFLWDIYLQRRRYGGKKLTKKADRE